VKYTRALGLLSSPGGLIPMGIYDTLGLLSSPGGLIPMGIYDTLG